MSNLLPPYVKINQRSVFFICHSRVNVSCYFDIKQISSECQRKVVEYVEFFCIFTYGFSPGLRTQLVQWKNYDYLLLHKVFQPKSVEAKL